MLLGSFVSTMLESRASKYGKTNMVNIFQSLGTEGISDSKLVGFFFFFLDIVVLFYILGFVTFFKILFI